MSRLAPALIAALALAAPAAAHALSRTVHVAWSVTNLHDERVLMHVYGPHTPWPAEHEIPQADLELGPGVGIDGEAVDFARDRVAFFLDPGETRALDFAERITSGHTWHYRATLYTLPAPGVTPRALASHDWKARVNLSGVDKCRMVWRIDPAQRLLASHTAADEPDPATITRDLAQTLIPGYDLAAALLANDPHAFLEAAAFEVLYASLDLVFPELGTLAALAVEGVEALIKSNPGRCVTHLVVRPPLEDHRQNLPGLTLRGGFGGAGYSFAGDFNGDGYPDIATADGGRIHIGSSRDRFDWREETFDGPTGWGSAGYTFAGDFDGDGQDDIASADGGRIYLRSRATAFAPVMHPVTARWGAAGYTRVADVDGDGRDDIVSAHGGLVFVKRARGDRFDSQEWPVDGRWGSAGYTFIGDFDGDGRDDIASANGGTVYVKLSRGERFDSQAWPVTGRWGSAGYTFVGDFDGDGRSDLASARGGEVYLMRSTGAGFRVETWATSATWGAAEYTRVGDFDGDGRDDLMSARGGVVSMRLSTGQGFVTEEWTVPDQWGDAGYTWIADFDQDGRDDIATAAEVQVFIRRSNGASFGFDAREPARHADGRANIAPGRAVRASSIAPAAVPARAIDGRRDGPPAATLAEPAPWIELDLGAALALGDLRVDAPAGRSLAGVVAELSTAPCEAPHVVAAAPLAGATTARALPGVGRYLCLRRPAGGALQIAEIEVWPR
ncbi:MAG: FG-GAP-like repeat-containing protein [bacterium]